MTVDDLWDDNDADLTGFYNDAAEQQARLDIASEETEEEEEKTITTHTRFYNNTVEFESKWGKFKT